MSSNQSFCVQVSGSSRTGICVGVNANVGSGE